MMMHITKCLDHLIRYLEPLLPIANSHMVDFFTQNIFEAHVHSDICSDINRIGYDDTLKLLFNPHLTDIQSPALQQFLNECRNNALPNFKDVCLNLNDMQLKLIDLGCTNLSGLHLEIFMTSKKSHEVEVMSEISAAVGQIAQSSHTIDIGDGKGYLSSALALHNGLKVLGVDSSDVNTKGAAKRNIKLNKILKNKICSATGSDNASDLYKQTTRFVSDDVDLMNLVKEHYPNDNVRNLSLVGLHTCGNLTSSCLKIFIQNPNIKSICNVGCCYHLLSESVDSDSGIPMSKYLKERRFCLGRNARMLSCQSLDRILDKKELPSKVLFYRSLLQILILKYCPSLVDRQVGRFGQKATTFLDYTQKAFKKFGANVVVPECEINALLELYAEKEKYLQIFYLLKAYIAPVIEAVILLDRLLYLCEQGIENAFLVQLFDPVISPRCYGIIAIK